jgi:hypothetical protein
MSTSGSVDVLVGQLVARDLHRMTIEQLYRIKSVVDDIVRTEGHQVAAVPPPAAPPRRSTRTRPARPAPVFRPPVTRRKR